MTRKHKLLQNFLRNPCSLSYFELEKLLLWLRFQKIPTRGSHIKFKHPSTQSSLIIPIHNNDCKDFYKKLALKIILENNLL